MAQKIPADRIALYCRALSDIGDKQLRYAFEQALKHLGEFLPSIEQLRTYAEQWVPVDPIAETRRILARDDKPTDWQALGSKSGVTAADVAKWLEEGKAAQREVIAELEADPEWRRMAARVGVHGLTRVPTDPAEKKLWAHTQAQRSGWLAPDREPGDES
jgi:hypothetical protein